MGPGSNHHSNGAMIKLGSLGVGFLGNVVYKGMCGDLNMYSNTMIGLQVAITVCSKD